MSKKKLKQLQELSDLLNDPKFDKARADANFELLGILSQHLVENPQIRFGQALRNLGFVKESIGMGGDSIWRDEFSVEPTELLKRVKETKAGKND